MALAQLEEEARDLEFRTKELAQAVLTDAPSLQDCFRDALRKWPPHNMKRGLIKHGLSPEAFDLLTQSFGKEGRIILARDLYVGTNVAAMGSGAMASDVTFLTEDSRPAP